MNHIAGRMHVCMVHVEVMKAYVDESRLCHACDQHACL